MRNQRGYTLVEMLVAISISTLLVLAISSFAVNNIIGSNQDYNKTLVLTNAKEAVGVVARQIRLARSVLAANTITDANQASGWTGTAGTGTPLILAVPSLVTPTLGGTKDILYIDGSHTAVYTDNVIFYLDPATHRLYKRTLANPGIPAGYVNTATTTCPPSVATASCPADADVVDDVANLATSYLKADGTTTSTPDNTEAVNYTVTETRTISGQAFTGTYTTIATLRNR